MFQYMHVAKDEQIRYTHTQTEGLTYKNKQVLSIIFAKDSLSARQKYFNKVILKIKDFKFNKILETDLLGGFPLSFTAKGSPANRGLSVPVRYV